MSSDMIGRQLGSYKVEELIERGGMVEVYRGHHVEIERDVAIKVIGRHLEIDPLLDERFRREVKAIIQLRHPNIVQVFDYGEEGGGHYAVMELVEGTTLADLIDKIAAGESHLEQDDINFIARQIASGLDHAHSRGVIHHDLSPANILIKPNGQVLVADFGLAFLKARNIPESEGSGIALGTPEYMAPEQAIDAARVTFKSDIYSLGVILYQLITGALPFTAETPVELALKHINETPLPPHQIEPTLPRAVSRVILMAMTKEPKDRFDRALGLVDALTQAWQIDDADDVVPLKSGALKRKGDPEPLPRPATSPGAPESEAAPTAPPPERATRAERRAAKPTRRRISPLVMIAFVIALLVLAGVFTGRAFGLNLGGVLRGALGRPAQTAPQPLIVATPTPESPSAPSPTTGLEAAGVTATPVITVVPEEAPIATPEPLNLPPLEVGTQVLRLADTSVMVYVPEGPFLMGTTDLSRPERERPQHEVTLSGYWIDQTEVTNAQYRLCVDAGACSLPVNTRNYDDPRYSFFPVAYVTWEAANAYCEHIGRFMGLDVRLPTEAQWEKAASWDPFTLTKRTYPWGEDLPTPDHLRYDQSFTVFQGAEVGTHPAGASAYGVFDMAGNMWEWVFDWSSEDYYSQPDAAVDPQGPAEGSGRIARGGSWARPGSYAVTTVRYVVETETRGEDIGFRCAANATALTPDNNVAFTPQEALGAAQAAVAVALAQGEGSDATLNDWQVALISMDAQLEAGNSAEVLLEIDSRLDTLGALVEVGNITAETALKIRNSLKWARSQLAAETEIPELTPTPEGEPTIEAVGG